MPPSVCSSRTVLKLLGVVAAAVLRAAAVARAAALRATTAVISRPAVLRLRAVLRRLAPRRAVLRLPRPAALRALRPAAVLRRLARRVAARALPWLRLLRKRLPPLPRLKLRLRLLRRAPSYYVVDSFPQEERGSPAVIITGTQGQRSLRNPVIAFFVGVQPTGSRLEAAEYFRNPLYLPGAIDAR